MSVGFTVMAHIDQYDFLVLEIEFKGDAVCNVNGNRMQVFKT
jgi:hypothetical protein